MKILGHCTFRSGKQQAVKFFFFFFSYLILQNSNVNDIFSRNDKS